MGFSRQEDWNGFPLPSSGDLPDLGIEPRLLPCRQIFLPSEPPGKHVNSGSVNLNGLRFVDFFLKEWFL